MCCGVCLVPIDVLWCLSGAYRCAVVPVRCLYMCCGVCLVPIDVLWCLSGVYRCAVVSVRCL